MTPEELRIICKQNGGQTAVAKLIPCAQPHINGLCNGKFPITKKFENHINLMFPKHQ